MTTPRPLVALYDCIGALPTGLAWTDGERARWLAMVTATVDALIAVRPAPRADVMDATMAEAVDALGDAVWARSKATALGSPVGDGERGEREDRARAHVLALHAAAVQAADAAGYARAMGEVDRAIGTLSGHEGDSVAVFVSSFGKCWNVASHEHGTSEAVHPTSPVAAILAAASALIDAAERPTPPASRFNDATTTGTAADVVVVNGLVHGGPPTDALDGGR